MLTQHDVAAYLLRQGLVSPEDIVDGHLVIRDASSRNRNFKVERGAGNSYLLKQGIGPDGAATVAHEAAMYGMLSRIGGSLRDHVPQFFGFDNADGVLIVELVPGGEDLRRYHLRHGQIPAPVAAGMGRTLGRLHRLTPTASEQLSPQHAPWILSIHRPDVSIFREVSSASLDLIRIVQTADGFADRLQQLREQWRVETLIHYDVKWDNFIAGQTPEPGQPVPVKLVDWETAMYGDPCWDIGSLFSHFLSTWLSSIPVTGETPPERFPELARYPLSAMFPAIAACWDAYRAETYLSRATTGRALLGATRMAAARLLQTAFETTQMSMSLNSAVVLHLQLAFNILQRPHEAVVHLLGLPHPGGS